MPSTSKNSSDFIPSRHDNFYRFFFNLYTYLITLFHYSRVDFCVLRQENFVGNGDKIFSDPIKLEKIHNDAYKHLELDPIKPILILCNHFSWWDSILVYRFNQDFLKKKFYAMVLLKTLLKSSILNKVGGYSIHPGKKSVIESLKYTLDLLSKGQNVILLFPQGKLYSNHIDKIQFMSGIFRLIKSIPEDCQILGMAGFIDYFSDSKPSIQFYVKKLMAKHSEFDIEEIYNSFYTQSRFVQSLKSS